MRPHSYQRVAAKLNIRAIHDDLFCIAPFYYSGADQSPTPFSTRLHISVAIRIQIFASWEPNISA